MERTLGIDVSFWQDNNSTPQQIDWRKAKTAGAVFAFIKASQATFTDSDFDYNWQEAKAASILRGAYHFYDYRISPKTQADHVIKLLKGDPGELPPVLDLEQHPNWPLPPRDTLLSAIKTFLETLEKAVGRKPLFYTNPSMIYYTLKPVPSWLSAHPLWIAHYGVPQPTMINPWTTWTFWQWTNKGDGLAFGMESKELDMNWFNGSEVELRAWAGVEPGPPPPLSLEEKVARLWAAHPELH
ncbi:MAG: glycoside hydrolase family 25 protein [Anaerolineaceae bacterium]|nr:glycoside hydrolase family 25 protein [Anaerolineaceae bacterium]